MVGDTCAAAQRNDNRHQSRLLEASSCLMYSSREISSKEPPSNSITCDGGRYFSQRLRLQGSNLNAPRAKMA